jgi:hypothetical protein
MPSRVSHGCSPCVIRVSVKNILLILLRNPHVDRYDPVDPAHPAAAAAHPRTLTAAPLKVTTTLDATELPAITVREGKPRVGPRIRLPDRAATAGIAAKSLRRARTAIRQAGERARAARAPRCRRHDCQSRRPNAPSKAATLVASLMTRPRDQS